MTCVRAESGGMAHLLVARSVRRRLFFDGSAAAAPKMLSLLVVPTVAQGRRARTAMRRSSEGLGVASGGARLRRTRSEHGDVDGTREREVKGEKRERRVKNRARKVEP